MNLATINFNDLLYFPVKQDDRVTEETDAQILRAFVRPSVVLMSVDQQTKENLLKTIQSCRKAKEELVVNIIFGAYKSLNVPSPLTTNWAEIFNVRFMLQNLVKIAHLYPHTIVLEYILQDTYLDRFNHISIKEIDEYIVSFFEIVSFYNQWLEKSHLNIRIDATRESDIVDRKIFKNHVEKKFEMIKTQWIKEPCSLIKIEAIVRASRNSRIANPSQEELFESAVFHTAYIQSCIELDIRQSKNKILLVHRKIRPDGEFTIPFRSCSSSAVQFWIGEGCLVRTADNVFSTILSPQRIEDYRLVDTVANDVFHFVNKNLKRIGIYERN